ncbi:hypothetical protein ABZ671_08110 [Micromonospora sp. NPDC006766]|uniref:hypothetical protein n=1 Tax=Micromonospora sp. NPDC006766 TaxID=3154778 RepID=UPI00340F51EE
MLRLVLRRSVAVVAVCLVAACGSSTAHTASRSADETIPSTAQPTSAAATTPVAPAVPATGGAGYSATLSARLLTTDSLPPGFIMEGIATSMPEDAGDQLSDADVSCSDSSIPLLSARRLTGTPSAMAAATLSYDAGPDDFWVGTEFLRTYSDDGARRAMTDLRTFIGRCPIVVVSSGLGVGDRHRFAVAPGPQLGDDSIHVSNSMTANSGTLEGDSLLVRIGTTLVAVQEEGNEPGGHKYLTQLAEAALRRYQATGS